MSTKEIIKEDLHEEEITGELSNNSLVLHNDDFNSFDFVIETLIDVCRHDSVQAEQCASITHYNGKCDIKNGSFSILKPIKDCLIDMGLSVTIDKI